MARYMLQRWALEVVEDMLDVEAKNLASPSGELRLGHNVTWDFAKGFSFQRVYQVARTIGFSILRVLEAISLPSSELKPHTLLSSGKPCHVPSSSYKVPMQHCLNETTGLYRVDLWPGSASNT